ncbi:MAG TPA: Holliday junction resolvase RuvX [Chitinispirillaceae bacterium]|nr:Holliday junction resolvase RuvX [Chitinispirillaceae bacterium]
MKLMGIDYGLRRVGVAVTDEQGLAIRGLTTIDRQKKPDLISSILSLIEQEKPQILVIGLPLDINDADTVMSKEIRSFAEKLQISSGLPVNFVDESYSSKKAAELMKFRKKKMRRDKAAIDRLAACLILESYREDQGWQY